MAAIPSELANLTKLLYMVLNNNELNGPIPSQLGNLTNLQWLRLSDNQLSGSIPAELGNILDLRLLLLTRNQLSGTVPSEFGNLSNVDTLGLGDNRLSGPIPAELGNMANLTILGLFNNELTGVLPESLTQLSMLEEFHYDNNSGLCASDDPAFQTWIGEIPDRVGDDCPLTRPAGKDDRAALTALYNATGGANWGNNTNWLSDGPLGEWYGVTTDTPLAVSPN